MIANSFWKKSPLYQLRMTVHHAIAPLDRRNGGPFSRKELLFICRDLLELPDVVPFHQLDREQCRLLIVRLLARSMI